MKAFNIPEYEGKTLLIAEVVNHWGQTHDDNASGLRLLSQHVESAAQRADQNMAILLPNTRQPIPFELRPGSSWSGFAIQDHQTMEKHSKTLGEMAREGYLFCGIYHSHSTRLLRRGALISQ